jgi:hypothetical protein
VPGCAGVRMSVRACSLADKRATRMRHIVTSIVAPLVPQYFSTLSHKRNDFRKKKVIDHTM